MALAHQVLQLARTLERLSRIGNDLKQSLLIVRHLRLLRQRVTGGLIDELNNTAYRGCDHRNAQGPHFQQDIGHPFPTGSEHKGVEVVAIQPFLRRRERTFVAQVWQLRQGILIIEHHLPEHSKICKLAAAHNL